MRKLIILVLLIQLSAVAAQELYSAKIVAVVDGDTVKVRFTEIPYGCELRETVRLIGVNTPELNRNNDKEAEYFSVEALNFINNFYLSSVSIELDPINGLRDKYGRLLAYIWLPNGKCLNELLIKEGYGYFYDKYQFNMQRMIQFNNAQGFAIQNKNGLWKKEDN